MSTPRQYELVYILAPDTPDQEVADLQGQVEGIIARLNGTLDGVDPWGRRKLAYEIGPHKEGIYTLVLFTGGPEVVKELDRRLKVLDRVVRHLIVRVDEDQAVAARRKAARQDESARRRAARGLPPLADAAGAPAAGAESAPDSVLIDTDTEGPASPAEA